MASVTRGDSKEIDEKKEASPFIKNLSEKHGGIEHPSNGDRLSSLSTAEYGNPNCDKELLQSLFEEAESARSYLRNHLNVFFFMLFTILYMSILYHQVQSHLHHKVALAHYPLLPPNYAANQANSFSSLNYIYSWLNNSIIQTVWTDTQCGDGLCDAPRETPAYGPDLTYGCASDCGIFKKTSRLYVKIETGFASSKDQAAATWNLCMRYPMEFCWYNQDQRFFGGLKAKYQLTLDVPDGEWTFQTNATLGTLYAKGSYDIKGKQLVFSYVRECNYGRGDFMSPYSRCRQQCETGFLECYVNQCPSISSKDLSSSFLQCLSICSVTTNATYQAELIASYNCSKKLAYINGNDGCPDNSPPPLPSPPPETISNILFNSSLFPRISYRTILWEKLGASDEERYTNLGFAVQRGLYSWIKDECFLTAPKSLGMVRRLTAFFCTYFGGPVSLPGCNYTSVYSGKNLTTDGALLREMAYIHSSMDLTKDQQDRFGDTFLWALQSVYFLDGSTVAPFTNRMHQLYGSIVLTEKKLGCLSAFETIPLADDKESNLTRNIVVGEAIKFVWEDDHEHSVITKEEIYSGLKPNISLEGFGSNNLYISRNEICSSKNLGSGDLDFHPRPCNLVDPSSSPPYSFTYSIYFGSNITKRWIFSSGRAGDSINGVVNVASQGDLSTECLIQNLANGHCDDLCNTVEFGFDGGDCACPVNEFGINDCSCPSGQVKNITGVCCDPGVNFTHFTIAKFGNGLDPAVTNAEIIGSGNMTFIRTTSNINRWKHLSFPVLTLFPLGKRVFQLQPSMFYSGVIVGMLVEQTRKELKLCDSDTKFTNLVDQCFGETSLSPFGIAPQTLLSSPLYDGTFLHDTSQIYDQNPYFSNGSLAFNSKGIPFAFYPTILNDVNYGFKYFFDVSLDNSDAETLLRYLRDGFFLDNVTSQVEVKLLTFNGEARLFTIVEVTVEMSKGGVLNVLANIHTLKVEHYLARKEWFRFLLEIVYLVALIFDVLNEMLEFLATTKKTKNILAYFHKFWNIIDLASVGIMVTGAILWVISVARVAEKFKVHPTYEIYESPITAFNYWMLSPETKINTVVEVFNTVRSLCNFRINYFSISGIKMLKLMSFHPRMGAITRTFAVAAPDLVHFFIVFGFVFFAYAFYAHLVFGRLLDQFRTITEALNSCFRMLMGQDAVADYLFRLSGWQLVAGVIFWWSFVTILILVVLNLLIGIVSDSYTELKVEVNKSGVQWIFSDVWAILRNLRKRFSPLSYSRIEISKALKKFGANKVEVEDDENGFVRKIEIDGHLVDENFLRDFLQRFPKHMEYNTERLAVDILEELEVRKLNSKEDDGNDKVEELKEKVEDLKSEVEHLKDNLELCLKIQLRMAKKLGVDLE